MPNLGKACADALRAAKKHALDNKRTLSWAQVEDIIETVHDTYHQAPPVSDVVPTPVAVYQAYPRKKGKLAALKAIEKAAKSTPIAELLERTKTYAKQCVDKDPQFIPFPATWFNAGSYMDEPDPIAPATKPDYINPNPLG